jgi:hypothetical protein
MLKETEQKALQLAKKVFEHFTHDALPIEMEIIALEREMAEDQEKPVTIPMPLQPGTEVTFDITKTNSGGIKDITATLTDDIFPNMGANDHQKRRKI